MKISIIIPTFRRPDMLPRAIDSILKQSGPWEIILINDDPADLETNKLLVSYARKSTFTRNIVIAPPREHRGFSKAVNHGIALATGDVGIVLADDDALCPDWLYAVDHWFTKKPDLVALWADYFITYDWKNFNSVEAPGADFAMLKEKQVIPGGGTAVRMNVLKREGLDETLAHNEDWDLMLRVLRHGRGMSVPGYHCMIVHSHPHSKWVVKLPAVGETSALIKR